MTNMHRRTFLAAAGITALAHGRTVSAPLTSSSEPLQLTGDGEWTYAVVSGWGALPAGTTLGGTHGAIAQDKDGNIYVSTQSNTGVLVYQSDRRLLRKIATAYPEIHSMVFATEGGKEYLYATVQKGCASRKSGKI
jgi:outer membrane protein assembly factor BamB